MPIPIPAPCSEERRRLISADFIRTRALERLYERKSVVEKLIRSLEDYQEVNGPKRAECIEFSGPQRCLLSSAR
jgi:hypothetical protein